MLHYWDIIVGSYTGYWNYLVGEITHLRWRPAKSGKAE